MYEEHTGNTSIMKLRTRHSLNAVCNDLARLQREAHAFAAHGDAVADADGVVLPSRHALLLDSGLDCLAQVED